MSFDGCSALTSFCGDLSSLTNGNGMFGTCDALHRSAVTCLV